MSRRKQVKHGEGKGESPGQAGANAPNGSCELGCDREEANQPTKPPWPHNAWRTRIKHQATRILALARARNTRPRSPSSPITNICWAVGSFISTRVARPSCKPKCALKTKLSEVLLTLRAKAIAAPTAVATAGALVVSFASDAPTNAGNATPLLPHTQRPRASQLSQATTPIAPNKKPRAHHMLALHSRPHTAAVPHSVALTDRPRLPNPKTTSVADRRSARATVQTVGHHSKPHQIRAGLSRADDASYRVLQHRV